MTRAADVLREVIDRRAAGERLPDEDIVRRHSDLMPELGELLRGLNAVEYAFIAAKELTTKAEKPPLARRLRVPSRAIPGFRILREISHGGQGIVYQAIQESLNREVAIKVMRGGAFASPVELARFDQEVEILSRLRHPSIVTILDRGITSGGHYFVMDFIRGVQIDEWSGSERSVHDRVEMFRRVCEAVHAAHIRGIIHRDLKPSNILVDESWNPKILDFGLAKLTDESTHHTAMTMTHTGQFVGSLTWASPEQIQGGSGAIDTRIDVYALGLILFQMLTGGSPYPVIGPAAEVMRQITQTEATRPSALRRGLGAELDAIVLKCLSKEPERRYENAGELARDVTRFLNGEPIEARRDSALYLLKKLVHRHRLVFASLALALITLIGFAVGMSILYGSAQTARRRAENAEQLAETRRQEAEREARTAQAVTDFLIDDVLASASPAVAKGRSITVAEAFEKAAARVSTAFVDDPLLRASVMTRVGTVYHGLGIFDSAVEALQEALTLRRAQLGELHPDTLEAKRALVDAFLQAGRYDDAEPLALETHDALREILGEDHLETLEFASRVVQVHWFRGRLSEADVLHGATYQRLVATVGADHPAALQTLGQNVAMEFLAPGFPEQADAMFRHGLEAARKTLGESDPTTLRLMASLGMTLMRQRRFEESYELQRQALEESRRVLGDRHLDTLTIQVSFAALQQQRGYLGEAETLYHQAYEGLERQFGDRHWPTIWALERLADVKSARDERGEALTIKRKVLELLEGIQEPANLNLRGTWDQLGSMLYRLDRYEEAITAHRTALGIFDSAHESRSVLVQPLRGIVRSLGAAGRPEEARPYMEELLDLRRQAAAAAQGDAYAMNAYAMALITAVPEDLRDADAALRLAMRAYDASTDEYFFNRYTVALCHEALGDLETAAEWLRRALHAIPNERSIFRNETVDALVRVLRASGKPEEAEDVHRQTLEARRLVSPPDPLDIAAALDDLGALLLMHGKIEEAESHLRECLNFRGLVPWTEENAWRLWNTQSLLGAALEARSAFAEADPLLIDAATQLTKSEFAPRNVVDRAVDRARQARARMGFQAWRQ